MDAKRTCLYLLTAYLSLAKAEVKGATSANNDSTPTTLGGDITIHYITVGQMENTFQPNSINAAVGDIVSFQFYPSNHSVIRSAYGYPCIPIEDIPSHSASPFFSGFQPVSNDLTTPPTWNLTVASTEPTFYYCGATGSCVGWGMLGVINANAETSLATQLELARAADYMLLPGQEAPDEAQLVSLSVAAYTATATITQTKSPTESNSAVPNSSQSPNGHHRLSGEAVAGVAVGTAFAVLTIVAVLWLLYRNRRLQRKLNHTRHSRSITEYVGRPSMVDGAAHDQNTFPRNSQFSDHDARHEYYSRNAFEPADPTTVIRSWGPGEAEVRTSSAIPASITVNGERYVAVPVREHRQVSWSNRTSPLSFLTSSRSSQLFEAPDSPAHLNDA